MLELVLASSCAPSMFRPKKDWERIHNLLVGQVPQPRETAQETSKVIESHIARIKNGFDTLRSKIEQVGPEALIVIGDDGGILFDQVQLPQFCLFTGEEFIGTKRFPGLGEDGETDSVTIGCHSKLSYFLLEETALRPWRSPP